MPFLESLIKRNADLCARLDYGTKLMMSLMMSLLSVMWMTSVFWSVLSKLSPVL